MAMSERPGVCLRRLGGDRAGERRLGGMLRHDKVTTAGLLAGVTAHTGTVARGRRVLVIQDTCLFSVRHRSRRGAAGPGLGRGSDQALLAHPGLAVDADTGALLGLCGGVVWTRAEGPRAPPRQREFEDKESVRWRDTTRQAKAALSAATAVTVVMDAEGDIFEVLADGLDERAAVLVRAAQDRGVVGGGRLFARIDALPVAERFALAVPARGPNQPARTAHLELRWGALELELRQHGRERGLPAAVPVAVVAVCEVGFTGTAADRPLHWRLLSSRAVRTLDEARSVVAAYKVRWTIEQLFRTAKSQGLDVEASQVTHAEWLLKLVVFALIAAVRILQLVAARAGSERRAEEVFTPPEMTALAAIGPSLEGRTSLQRNPFPFGQLSWAAWIIARLGGWKSYSRSERPPGPITMRHGLERFQAMAHGFGLAQSITSKDAGIP